MVYDILDIYKFFHNNLTFERNVVEGLAVKFKVFYPNCNENIEFENCCKIEDHSAGKIKTFYHINISLVNGLRTIGKGQTAGKISYGMLNVSAPPTTYKKHEDKLRRLRNLVEKVGKKLLKKL